jgi:hypothetical protein
VERVKKNGGIPLGEVARVVFPQKTDWQAMYEEQLRQNHQLRADLGSARKQVATLSLGNGTLIEAAKKHNQVSARLDDMRRAIAGRLMSALIIAGDDSDGEAGIDMAEHAVELTDHLINMLLATKKGAL